MFFQSPTLPALQKGKTERKVKMIFFFFCPVWFLSHQNCCLKANKDVIFKYKSEMYFKKGFGYSLLGSTVFYIKELSFS